jgi:hypothetical protein
MHKYRVCGNEIIAVEYVGEWDYISAKHYRIFNTWEEAHDHLIINAELGVDEALGRLEMAVARKHEIMRMRPPNKFG